LHDLVWSVAEMRAGKQLGPRAPTCITVLVLEYAVTKCVSRDFTFLLLQVQIYCWQS